MGAIVRHSSREHERRDDPTRVTQTGTLSGVRPIPRAHRHRPRIGSQTRTGGTAARCARHVCLHA
eukprot:14192132-Alexandrium_andersonii.AAC.1